MDERFECCRYEPSLEDLLADEVMTPVLRSAGLEAQEFRGGRTKSKEFGAQPKSAV
jgi:hypothetical protein